MLKKNAIIIYYNNGLKLQNNLFNPEIDHRQRTIKKLVEKGLLNIEVLGFPLHLNYKQIEEIINDFHKYGKRTETNIVISDTVYQFIDDNKFQINEIAKRGVLIKNQDRMFLQNFNEFKSIVDKEVDRSLFEIQNRVAFYQAMMKRVVNFSVPGAGKTTMVYGTFAYLSIKEINKVSRIVMIGPKNSFLS